MIKKRGRARENGKGAAPKISKFASLLYRYAETRTAKKDTNAKITEDLSAFLKLENGQILIRFETRMQMRQLSSLIPVRLAFVGYRLSFESSLAPRRFKSRSL